VKLTSPKGGKMVWTTATTTELDQLEDHLKRIERWQGIGTLNWLPALLLPACFILLIFIRFSGRSSILLWDLVILFAPAFLTGNRSAWEPPGLRTKVKNLKELISTFPWKDYPDYSYHLQFAIRRKLKGSYPTDVRLKIEKKTGPPDLIGIQGQYTINRVKGQEYPYFYVVILAKKGFDLKQKILGVGDWTVEFESDQEVDVCVIRQYTTKRSGYHTPLSTQVQILRSGIETLEELNGSD
jgi:hypothetical protein